MPRITWTDRMSCGVAVIDDDHKVLVNQFNRLADAVEGDTPAPSGMLGGIIESLLDYTAFHFEREVQLMRLTGFPGSDGHAREHDRLVDRLADLGTQWRGGALTGRQLLTFVGEWLAGHILRSDQALGRHVIAKGADELVAPRPTKRAAGKRDIVWDEVSVMIADDSVHFRRLLRGVLHAQGIRHMIEVRNGAEALEALAGEAVDVVLAADTMPVLGGVEMTRQLRRSSGRPDPRTCVILMANEGVTRDRLREATLAGIHDLLIKPVTADTVHARLRRHLGRPLSFQNVGGALIPVRTAV